MMDPTKRRLLDAAGEEFAEKGFDGATVRAICQRAGANVAAVNYHFGDKEQLYVQAVMEAHRCGSSPFATGPDAGAPAEQLRRFIHHFLSQTLGIDDSGTWHQTLMLRELMRPTPASKAVVREAIRPKFEHLMGLLRGIQPGCDERRLHAVAFSVVGQCLHYRVGRRFAEELIGPSAFARLDVEYLTDHITRFSLAALGAGPPLACDGDGNDQHARPAAALAVAGEGPGR